MSKYTEMLAAYGVTNAHPGGGDFTDQLLKRLSVNEGMEVVEIGCGIGDTAKKLACSNKAKVTAIDMNRKMIEKARKRHAGVQGITWIEGCFMELNFPDKQFDLIIGESVLSFMDLENCLEKFSGLLKPGGKVCMLEPVYSGGLPEEILQEYKSFYGFKSLLSENEWKKLFSKYQFTSKDILYGEDITGEPEEEGTIPEFVLDMQLQQEHIETLEKHMELTNKYLAYFDYAYFIFEKG
ncbi:class I SAM-dependent methyltransferase [Evansella sp. LMS18]|uniref:class I SAM-dependent methyltransferase n=1 Tax=Evansella sp. LMS18 TaxID=2924033 RepID=UPI0020D04748|nr:class I SAM-dependent methyltransferase [Evansella sp. LMS18]UTR11200.1 class I SAM-dependent methyltransferase [Evansella sp. LMS18]